MTDPEYALRQFRFRFSIGATVFLPLIILLCGALFGNTMTPGGIFAPIAMVVETIVWAFAVNDPDVGKFLMERSKRQAAVKDSASHPRRLAGQ